MKKIIEFKEKHTVWFSIIICLLSTGFVLLRKVCEGVFDVFGYDTNLYWLMREIAFMIPVMALVVLSG